MIKTLKNGNITTVVTFWAAKNYHRPQVIGKYLPGTLTLPVIPKSTFIHLSPPWTHLSPRWAQMSRGPKWIYVDLAITGSVKRRREQASDWLNPKAP